MVNNILFKMNCKDNYNSFFLMCKQIKILITHSHLLSNN